MARAFILSELLPYIYALIAAYLWGDGVLEASLTIPGEDWITKLLAGPNEDDPQVIAELVINEALRLANDKPRDDMNAICVRIDRL